MGGFCSHQSDLRRQGIDSVNRRVRKIRENPLEGHQLTRTLCRPHWTPKQVPVQDGQPQGLRTTDSQPKSPRPIFPMSLFPLGPTNPISGCLSLKCTLMA